MTVGMFFDVIGSQHDNIKDPDTNEVLGSIMRPKVRVKIIDVQVKLSVATTYRRENVSMQRPFADFLMFSHNPTAKYKYETLDIADTPAKELEEIDSYVKTGDKVIEVNRNKKAYTESADDTDAPLTEVPTKKRGIKALRAKK